MQYEWLRAENDRGVNRILRKQKNALAHSVVDILWDETSSSRRNKEYVESVLNLRSGLVIEALRSYERSPQHIRSC